MDLQSPNGIYEVLLFEAAHDAYGKFFWDKYRNKNIYFPVEEITNGYLDNVVSALVSHKLLEAEGNILTIVKTKENKDVPIDILKQETDFDFDLYITVPVSGVNTYEGFLTTNHSAYVVMNLYEKTRDGSENNYTSGVIVKKFDSFIPSRALIAGIWTLLIATIVYFMIGRLIRLYRH